MTRGSSVSGLQQGASKSRTEHRFQAPSRVRGINKDVANRAATMEGCARVLQSHCAIAEWCVWLKPVARCSAPEEPSAGCAKHHELATQRSILHLTRPLDSLCMSQSVIANLRSGLLLRAVIPISSQPPPSSPLRPPKCAYDGTRTLGSSMPYHRDNLRVNPSFF